MAHPIESLDVMLSKTAIGQANRFPLSSVSFDDGPKRLIVETLRVLYLADVIGRVLARWTGLPLR